MTKINIEVRYGYTMADLDAIARASCRADRSLASDADTRYSVAWSAVAEALCAAEHPPRREDLVREGWQAIYREVREMRVMFGFKDREGTHGVASAPRYIAYWSNPPLYPADGVVDRLAVGQILATLPPIHQEVIVALAVHDDYQAAADSIGLQYAALKARLIKARRQFRAAWFAPESAPPVKGTDRRVGAYGKPLATHCQGGTGPHEMTPENTRYQANPKPGRRPRRVCRACEADRGRARVAARQAARRV